MYAVQSELGDIIVVLKEGFVVLSYKLAIYDDCRGAFDISNFHDMTWAPPTVLPPDYPRSRDLLV